MDSREVVPGVMLDFDAAGNPMGIGIDHAGEIVILSRLEAESLPIEAFSPERATSAGDRLLAAGSGWGACLSQDCPARPA